MKVASSWLDKIVTHAPYAIVVVDASDLLILEANLRSESILVCKKLVGRNMLEVLSCYREEEIKNVVKGVCQEGRASEIRVLAGQSGKGTGILPDRWLDIYVLPLETKEVNPVVVMFIVDVTLAIRSQRALTDIFEERLETATEARHQKLAKQELMAAVEHELRNAMAPILSALELMRLKEPHALVDDSRMIHRQAMHVLHLLDDLQDASEAATVRGARNMEPADLTDLVKKALAMSEPLMQRQRHLVELDLFGELLPCRADKDRIIQALLQILGNAARFTRPGGVIQVSTARDGASVLATVKDNGFGISAEALPKVFELFFQNGNDLGRANGMMGFGLTVAKNVVEAHAGCVTVRSDGPGTGSEFSLRLPLLTPQRPSQASIPPAAKRGERRRIMVVDDNEDGAQSIAELLRVDGHDVEVAHLPLLALEAALRFQPQIAFVDIGLPGMDGYELAARLREEFESRGLPACRFIALTGYGEERTRLRSAKEGFAAHLVKPVSILELQTSILDAA